MATQKSTQPTRQAREIADSIDTRLSQLSALLISNCGGSAENFEEIGPELRDTLMCLAFDITREIKGEFERLQAVQHG